MGRIEAHQLARHTTGAPGKRRYPSWIHFLFYAWHLGIRESWCRVIAGLLSAPPRQALLAVQGHCGSRMCWHAKHVHGQGPGVCTTWGPLQVQAHRSGHGQPIVRELTPWAQTSPLLLEPPFQTSGWNGVGTPQ